MRPCHACLLVINSISYFNVIAISNGIMENDAFKQTTGELQNEKWTQLLLDFGFFDDTQNRILDLRLRFVLGAADWLAGNNGSLRNYKELLGYTDPHSGNISGIQCLKMELGLWQVLWMLKEMLSKKIMHQSC